MAVLPSIVALARVRRPIGVSGRTHVYFVVWLVPCVLHLVTELLVLITVFNLELLPLLIDIGDVLVAVGSLTIFLFDRNLLFGVRALGAALRSAITHL